MWRGYAPTCVTLWCHWLLGRHQHHRWTSFAIDDWWPGLATSTQFMKYNPVSLVDVAAQLGFLTINFFGRNPSTALVWKTTLVPAANCKLFSCFLFPSFQNLAWSWALHSSNHNSLIFDVGTKNVIPNLDLDFFQLRPVRWLARQAPIRGYYRSPQYTIGCLCFGRFRPAFW